MRKNMNLNVEPVNPFRRTVRHPVDNIHFNVDGFWLKTLKRFIFDFMTVKMV